MKMKTEEKEKVQVAPGWLSRAAGKASKTSNKDTMKSVYSYCYCYCLQLQFTSAFFLPLLVAVSFLCFTVLDRLTA